MLTIILDLTFKETIQDLKDKMSDISYYQQNSNPCRTSGCSVNPHHFSLRELYALQVYCNFTLKLKNIF